MLDDFQMIKVALSQDIDEAHIYPIGDVHIGSAEFNEEEFLAWRKRVEDDPVACVVIIGDMMNMGLKTSKTNVYDEMLNPATQKEACYNYLLPIRDKIIGGCSGNHEHRGVREAGMNPLYDVFCWLHIQDRYRENACFIKLGVGKSNKHKNRQVVYGITLTHGASKNKDEQWTYSIDGCDVFVSGHTHNTLHKPLGKIVMDMRNNTVSCVPIHHIVVEPFQNYGGYALRGKYMPKALGGFQIIKLDGRTKQVGYVYN